MSHELCEGYKHKIIYRLIQKHNENNQTKYLFVGPGLEKKVQKVLEKLADGGYKNIDSSDVDLLNKHIHNSNIL